MPPSFRTAPVRFYGCSADDDLSGAGAAIFGAPHGTPYRDIPNEPFASAPDALRMALDEDAGWEHHWDFDLDGPLLNDTSYKIADLGNLTTVGDNGPSNRDLIRGAAKHITAQGAVPIMIGGDDSTPIPFLEGLASKGPLTILQIDAHIDWREERRGEPLGYSSTMRRASEMSHVEKIIQVGMRGLGSARREEVTFARDWGAEIVTARAIHEQGPDPIVALISEGANCAITVDCDAFDAGIMPAVMAPTPGGLTYYQVVDLIHLVSGKANIIGFDMIEFVPERDTNGTAAITAARVIANLFGALARKPG